jgi:hypothetical protein
VATHDSRTVGPWTDTHVQAGARAGHGPKDIGESESASGASRRPS